MSPLKRGNLKQGKEPDMKSILDEKFRELSSQIATLVEREVDRHLLALTGKTTTLPSQRGVPGGARINAPSAPTLKRSAAERPVPSRKVLPKRSKDRSGTRADATTPANKTTTAVPSQSRLIDLPREQATTETDKRKETTESWSKVVGRKAKKKPEKRNETEGKATKTLAGKPDGKLVPPANNAQRKAQNKKPHRRRVPRTAAVVLTCTDGQYAEKMARIRSRVKLSKVGIQDTTRTAATGALVIEVPGVENGPKADALASRMREVLKDKEGVRIHRPIKTAEIRIRGLESSIRKEEVIEAVAEKGVCHPHEIQVGEVRKISGNQGSLWLRLPLVAAKKAVEGGSIQIGWSKVRISLLEARPLRCHKCLERGHVRERCPIAQDRSDRCYRCGERGHIARKCIAPPKCPICSDIGRRADHTLGSQQCTTQAKRGTTEASMAGTTNRPARERSPSSQHIRGSEDLEQQPEPQRCPRNRSQRDPPCPQPTREQEMETEPLEEGTYKDAQ